MYGKHFHSMYEGSMIGAGAVFYAVWGYVIAKMRPDKEVGAQVELNPKLLAFIIGEDESEIIGAIEKMCRPDPKSRTKDEEGRKLIKLGEFDYKVVNGPKYMAIRNEEERRENNRRRQAVSRQRRQKKSGPSRREVAFVKAQANGDEDACDKIAAMTSDTQLPVGL